MQKKYHLIKKIFININAVVMSIVLTLLLLEIFFRVFGISPIPNGELSAVGYKKNSKGIRDYEYDYAKKEEVFRILGIGDSFTEGAGVSNLEDIFLKRLEKELNDSFNCSYQVINGGQSDFNTKDEYEWLKDEGIKYSPDLIIVIYFFNDATGMNSIDEITKKLYGNYHLSSQRFDMLYPSARFKSYIYNFFKYRFYCKKITQKTLKEYKEAYFSNEEKTRQWMECKENILLIKKLAEENNSKILFVIFPILYDLDDNYILQDIHDAIYNFLIENNIETYSLLPAFQAYKGKAETLWVNSLDSHPNEKAHRIVADSLFTYLKDSDLLNK